MFCMIKVRLIRCVWCSFFVMLMGIFTAHAQTYTIEPPLSGEALAVTEQAEAAMRLGDLKRAKRLAKEARRLRPNAIRVHQLLTQILKNEIPGKVKTVVDDAFSTSSRVDSVSKKQFSARLTHRYDKVSDVISNAQTVYELINKGDSKAALSLAREGVKIKPDDQKMAMAHVNALITNAEYVEADFAVNQAISRFGSNISFLLARDAIRRTLAESESAAVYRALELNDLDKAVQAASKAVNFEPDVIENRLLLVQVLMRAEQYDEAVRVTSQAIAIDPDDVLLLMLRGYSYQYLEQRQAAINDFSAVLSKFDLTTQEQKFFRAIMADAALAAAEPQTALDLLLPLGNSSDDPSATMVTWRRRQAQLQLIDKSPNGKTISNELRPLNFQCRSTPYGRECELLPAFSKGDPAYLVASAAYDAIKTKDYPLALEMARQAVFLNNKNIDYQKLLLGTLELNGELSEAENIATKAITAGNTSAEILVQRGDIREQLNQKDLAQQDFSAALKMETLPLAQTLTLLAKINRKEQARERLHEALKAGKPPVKSDLELAYLAVSIEDDGMAIDAFKRADQEGALSTSGLQDAAYTAIRVRQDPLAIDYLSRSVEQLTGEPPLELKSSAEIQSLLNLRRTITEVSRTWGGGLSMSYRGAMPGAGGLGSNVAVNQSTQLGSELYWRPFGYRNGQWLEVYTRGFETLNSSAGGLTGSDSVQGSVGVRWKPFSESGFIFVLGRLFPIGSKMNSDWLGQVAYSNGSGGELRIDSPSWWTQQYYGEAGRYLQDQQTYAAGNARWGRSYRLDAINQNLVITPHAVLAADYNTAYTQPGAVGLGLGLQLRYWYREDKYHAHRSYVDFVLQYRTPIQGDEQRAKGTFLTVVTSF